MLKDSRELGIVFFALALFFSSSLTKLHAKQVFVEAPPFRIEKLVSFVKWHITEIAEIERNEAFLFAPGN